MKLDGWNAIGATTCPRTRSISMRSTWIKVAKGEERFPVHDVTWYEAEAYCKSLGKRLHTEAEWERAVRGGLDRKKFECVDSGVVHRGNAPDASPGGLAEQYKQPFVVQPMCVPQVR